MTITAIQDAGIDTVDTDALVAASGAAIVVTDDGNVPVFVSPGAAARYGLTAGRSTTTGCALSWFPAGDRPAIAERLASTRERPHHDHVVRTTIVDAAGDERRVKITLSGPSLTTWGGFSGFWWGLRGCELGEQVSGVVLASEGVGANCG